MRLPTAEPYRTGMPGFRPAVGWFILLVGLVWSGAVAPGRAAPSKGEQLYRKYCSQCHSKSRVLRAPNFSVLRRMQPQDVLDSLEFGTMRFEGVQRTIEERRAIAEFVTGRQLAQEQQGKEILAGRCAPDSPQFAPDLAPQWNGWGAGTSNARFQSAQEAGLIPDQVQKLKVKWAFGFPPKEPLHKLIDSGKKGRGGTAAAEVW
jgi:polyvinyl alcohol dehydrogenase (cytochrome)